MWSVLHWLSCEADAMRVAVPITLTKDERRELQKFARGRSTPARLVLRAKIVLRAFIWTAKASDILAQVSRAKAALSDKSPSV